MYMGIHIDVGVGRRYVPRSLDDRVNREYYSQMYTDGHLSIPCFIYYPIGYDRTPTEPRFYAADAKSNKRLERRKMGYDSKLFRVLTGSAS